MYRSIVAWKVRKSFAGLSAGDGTAVTSGLAKEFVYSFRGSHALGGTRTNIEDMDAWFARVFRLFPGLRFDVKAVTVGGPPWNTTVLTHVEISDGDYHNEFFQRITLVWGQIREVITLEDLELLGAKLAKMKSKGIDEAGAVPIQSQGFLVS